MSWTLLFFESVSLLFRHKCSSRILCSFLREHSKTDSLVDERKVTLSWLVISNANRTMQFLIFDLFDDPRPIVCQLFGSHGHDPGNSNIFRSFFLRELYFQIIGVLWIRDQTFMNVNVILVFLADRHSVFDFEWSFGGIGVVELALFLVEEEHSLVCEYSGVV